MGEERCRGTEVQGGGTSCRHRPSAIAEPPALKTLGTGLAPGWEQGTSMTPNSDGVVCVDRGALARHMVMHAQAEFPDISFRFHMTCKVGGRSGVP